jgi:SAM-dependent methyltransferase
MYNQIKKIVKTIIPKRILFSFEPIFRSFLYLFYKGDKFKCNICNKGLRKFINNDDKLCPHCGSLSRTRRLWDILNTILLKENISILDFSPSRSLYRILKNNASISYMSTDLSGDFLSDFKYDITNIDVRDESYDLVICYHVLEHIKDDTQAMKELFRILRKGGICIVQTPFKQGDIYEDFSIQSDEDRLKHFGQKDHVRIYSISGLMQRLIDCGFNVEIREFNAEMENKFGFKSNESVLLCYK